MKKGLLTAGELADHLGISRASVYRRRSEGYPLPPAIRIGGCLRWRLADVEEFLAKNIEKEVNKNDYRLRSSEPANA